MLKEIDSYLKKKLDNNDFYVMLEEISKECKYSPIYQILLERLYQLMYAKDKMVHPEILLKLPLESDSRLEPDYLVQSEAINNEYYEISEGLSLKKGLIFKILEKLNFIRSKEALIYELMKNNEELQDKVFMNKCEQYDLTDFNKEFEEECNKWLK